MAGDWQGMMRIEQALFDGAEELVECGRLYRSLGLSEQAINAFIRAHRPDLACKTAVELNDWEKAVKLAETHKLDDVSGLLEKKAASLLDAKLGKSLLTKTITTYFVLQTAKRLNYTAKQATLSRQLSSSSKSRPRRAHWLISSRFASRSSTFSPHCLLSNITTREKLNPEELTRLECWKVF